MYESMASSSIWLQSYSQRWPDSHRHIFRDLAPPLHLPSCTKADLFTLFMFQIQHPSRSLATLLLEGLRLVKFLEGRDTGLFQTVLDSSVSEDLRLLTANLQTHLR